MQKLYFRLNEKMNSRFRENLAMLAFVAIMALYHFITLYLEA